MYIYMDDHKHFCLLFIKCKVVEEHYKQFYLILVILKILLKFIGLLNIWRVAIYTLVQYDNVT